MGVSAALYFEFTGINGFLHLSCHPFLVFSEPSEGRFCTLSNLT